MSSIAAELTHIVINNNYNKLQDNIYNGIDVNKYELLTTSIRFRAIECFDILLNIQDKNKEISDGLHQAISYYVNAPNVRNYYFLERLLTKNIYIANATLILTIDIPELFDDLLDRMIKKNNICKYICSLINSYDKLTNNYFYYKIFNYIEKMNDNDKIEAINTLKIHIFSSKNIEIIYFLESKNIDLLRVNIIDCIERYTKEEPILYYVLANVKRKNNLDNNIINYIINYYSKHSYETINAIKNIDKPLFHKFDITEYPNIFQKIFKLNINFTDFAYNLINNIFSNHKECYHTCINNRHNSHIAIIYSLFKNNKIIKEIFIVYMNELVFPNLKSSCTQNNNIILSNILCILSYFDIDVFSFKNINTNPELFTKMKSEFHEQIKSYLSFI